MARCSRSTQLFQRIEKANELLERCSNLDKSIDGLSKLKRKIVAELKFLKSLESIPEPFQASYIKSTNLSFFEAVLVNCEQEKDVVAVIKPFCYVDINSDKLIFVVDVVADNGYCWIKVTARNASALHWIWQGGGDFGDKDIFHQTKMLQETSKQHPWNFSPPHVMLFCYNGITESLAKAFTSIGINVKGKILTDPGKELTSSGIDESFVVDRPHTQQCNLVNLDITTMIALVSALTNGGCGYVFKEPILTEQAKQERKSPVLPKVKLFLQGKELFACQTAVRDFNTILKTVGGVKEQERARDLLDTVTIVDDNPSTRSSGLQLSATIKKRSKVIFGTGDSMKAITSTANVSFTRAAANQGVEFSVFIHDSRALTESKEGQATLVEDLV
ncbi:UPF0415 protein C7orf25 homolog [Montipora capricornis]|uniref:UPF0415 protein C7orf25 homolog n=1 Tax=Montipora capricornis TaxID=246305 RepID=UPI0035F1CC51